MNKKMKLLKRMLLISLEDLLNDLEDMLEAYIKSGDAHGGKGHVYKENITVYKNQLYGLKKSIELITKSEVENYTNPESMKRELTKNIKDIYRKSCLFPVGLKILIRRIERTYNYFLQEHLK